MTLIKPFLDQQLTGISTKLVPQGYISERILTSTQSKFTSGKISGYTKDHLRITNTVTGQRGTYPRVEVSVARTDSFSIDTHGLSHQLVEDDFDNAITPFDPRRDATIDLTTMLWLGKEKGLADALTTAASYGANTVTLSGTDQYSDYTNSDPLGDFAVARGAIHSKTGMTPNKVVMSWATAEMLRFHPQILEVGFKYNRSGQLTNDDLAMVMQVKELIIGEAVYNTAKPGQTDVMGDIWGKDIIFMYAPATGSLNMQTFGWRIQKAGESPRRVFRNATIEPPNSELIQVDDKYDMLITDASCGYLIKGAIA